MSPQQEIILAQPFWALRVDRLMLGLSLSQWQEFEPNAEDGLIWLSHDMPRKEWIQRMQEALSEHAEIVHWPRKPQRELYLVFSQETDRDDCFAKFQDLLSLPDDGVFIKFHGHSQWTFHMLRSAYLLTWREEFAAVNARSVNPKVQRIDGEVTDVFLNFYRMVRGRAQPLVGWDTPLGQGHLVNVKTIGGKVEYHRGNTIFEEALREAREELNLDEEEMDIYFPKIAEPRGPEEVRITPNMKNPHLVTVTYFVEVRWTDAQWKVIQEKVKCNVYEIIGLAFVPITYNRLYNCDRFTKATNEYVRKLGMRILPDIRDQFYQLHRLSRKRVY